ncbi:MAG: S8 family serine peptidase, partial [Elusimicrobia bacterium]|nr:S8 family serine peptidase [Elusimicrobiota bacterium]
MHAPRLLLLLALAVLPGAVRAGTEVAPIPELPIAVTIRRAPPALPLGPDEEPAVPVSPSVREALKKVGWKVLKDGGLERLDGADKGFIPLQYLSMADLTWRNGELIFARTPMPVSHEMFAPMLKGLSSFTSAASVERAKAGSALAAWGFPPSVDGRRLYNPGGEATYYGIMLHSFFASKPDLVARLGVERTSQALDLLDEAFFHAFRKQAPDVAQVSLDRARVILFAPARGGETPLGAPSLKARPDPAAMLKDYKTRIQAEADAALKAGDEVRRKDSVEALAVLNTLERQRMNHSLDLAVVPEPGKAPADEPLPGPEPEYTPLASGLPGVLRVLERVNGKPLTSDQQENLIRSFPMGDLVWRMGAQDLWRQGLTGKGVRVAVIDEGVAENQELDAAVKARVNLTSQRGEGSVGDHGTHVAGIIHALAPDAELRSYAALASDGSNPMLREFSDAPIINAIHRAVKDGNHVINMSLGSAAGPSADMARVVEEYASKGVIFLIATGNSRAKDGGVGAPSSAPSAISVGSLNAAGR